MADTAQRIADRLAEKLGSAYVHVEDESSQHVGHEGAREGGHFRVLVVSPDFAGKSLVERHRMIYDALGSEMEGIHALAIEAREP